LSENIVALRAHVVRDLRVQTVKKLYIKNKRVFQPDHISYMVSSMSVTLKRFTGLHGFFTKISSLVGYGPQNFQVSDEDRQSISEVFAAWPQLARVNYNDQPIDLPGSFDAMFTPIIGNLTKLSLVRASVCYSGSFLVNMNSRSRSLYAIARPSVCRLSVTLMRPTQAVQIFGNISTALGTLAIH